MGPTSVYAAPFSLPLLEEATVCRCPGGQSRPSWAPLPLRSTGSRHSPRSSRPSGRRSPPHPLLGRGRLNPLKPRVSRTQTPAGEGAGRLPASPQQAHLPQS